MKVYILSELRYQDDCLNEFGETAEPYSENIGVYYSYKKANDEREKRFKPSLPFSYDESDFVIEEFEVTM